MGPTPTRALSISRVAQLERELDVRLFERTARGVYLTDAGQALIGPARRTLNESRSIRGSVASMRDGVRGTLSIVASSAQSDGILGDYLSAFHAALPHVELRVAAAESSVAAADAVVAGEYDIALVEMPVQPALKVLPVVEEEFYALFAGAGITDPTKGIPTMTRELLQGRTMLHLPLAQFPRQRSVQLWHQFGADPLRHLELADCTLQVSVARSGGAVAVLPRVAALAGWGAGLDIAAPPRAIRRTVGFARQRTNTSAQVTRFLGLARRLRPSVNAPISRAATDAMPLPLA
ncbi:LysR family transcriptional regulator [Microbacterium wangruii]|uniref:LysR family transcriptional regulator n=1 Tax=Microbacterium wangruii TaxID=3049073 RepID=UPI00256F2BE7|nr:LysR family transcriptional regulator [Microbacterium sp. zg-Y1211]MDL5486833.1 LysR family transcriptional regulator [Microbacterium sp. zg-Y1211]